MSQKYFYIWICVLAILSYFCRIVNNMYLLIPSMLIICSIIILFYKARRNEYKKSKMLSYKTKLCFEMLIVVFVSCALFVMDNIILRDKSGVYFTINLSLVPLLVPIIINSARLNRIVRKTKGSP